MCVRARGEGIIRKYTKGARKREAIGMILMDVQGSSGLDLFLPLRLAFLVLLREKEESDWHTDKARQKALLNLSRASSALPRTHTILFRRAAC